MTSATPTWAVVCIAPRVAIWPSGAGHGEEFLGIDGTASDNRASRGKTSGIPIERTICSAIASYKRLQYSNTPLHTSLKTTSLQNQ
jgi:hypothetical protein